MILPSLGRLATSLYSSLNGSVIGNNVYPSSFVPLRNYAARKGTRERKRALLAKKKLEKKAVEKKEFTPILRKKGIQAPKTNPRNKEENKSAPTDDVWATRYYSWKIYSFEEAVNCHRESHHPTMHNMPNALISAFIELDMTDKKKYVAPFNRLVSIPHIFDHSDKRSVMVFGKSDSLKKIALDAGADFFGDTGTIKNIQTGDININTYDFCIAHPQILAELLLIKGILKLRFPMLKKGTLTPDVASAIHKFKHGVKYNAVQNEEFLDYGSIVAPIGKLNMEIKQLEDNLSAILQDINTVKPKREGDFITRVYLTCPASPERLKIEYKQYLTDDEKQSKKKEEEDDEDEDEDDPQSAVIPSQ
ncbi:large ribosomal subunit protein uL1m [Prorops nasuta]|uniref:large ribosomal subunit protein uL1m n=1 Tax=Prorops nasuta TaxID=863751 RepID=UPI0034D01E56